MNNNIKNILSYLHNESITPYHRFNSWRKCYEYFQSIYLKCNGNDDVAALHLGFYLASWGMYRGSTFLLQNDYSIHDGVIQILKESKHNICNHRNEEVNCEIKVISEINDKIIAHYKKAHPNSKGNNHATDTLVTKILLGTLGITPAYDRYFIEGIKFYNADKKPEEKIEPKFTGKSIVQLNLFYNNHIAEFKQFEDTYPKMKLLDMYFWQLGYSKDNENKNADE